jgi:hypothetical protein
MDSPVFLNKLWNMKRTAEEIWDDREKYGEISWWGR